MFKNLVILCFILCSYTARCEEQSFDRPNYTLIRKLTQDKKSEYFYPKLFSRYQKLDTSLQAKDYKMLYYGYFFQHNYMEQGNAQAYNDSIKQIMHKDQLSKNEWNKLIGLVHNYLIIAPYDLQKMKLLFIAYHNINDEQSASLYRNRLEMLIKTILSTGDGKTDKTAYHVLEVGDEYAIISVLGYDFGGVQELTSSQCDYLKIGNNMDGIKGIYFDVKQIMNQYNKLLKDR